MSNEELVTGVIEELDWDPQVGNDSITVEADDGVVVLRGRVGSFREKREAQKTAQRVLGVKKVENDLHVHLMGLDALEDDELRADLLHALSLDALVPKTVSVSVDEGVVTLTGTVESQHQRAEVETVTADVFGVVDIVDKIEVTGPNQRARDVVRSISSC